MKYFEIGIMCMQKKKKMEETGAQIIWKPQSNSYRQQITLKPNHVKYIEQEQMHRK